MKDFCALIKESCRTDCKFYNEVIDSEEKKHPQCIFEELTHLHSIEIILYEMAKLQGVKM